MGPSEDKYAVFKASLREISKLTLDGRSLFASLSMGSWVETCDRMQQRLASERFRVIILGEFKRGKSTFINAMLGREVLPAFATPCTAIINEVKWGSAPRSILHFKNPLPPQLPPGLPLETLGHIEKHRGRAIPPLPVSVEDLERYVAIPDPVKDQAVSIAETPYDHVEIFWPLPLLQNGVEIIDSPGLNEHGSRTKVTMDYLGKIDAVIFVFSVHALASQSELAVIDHDVRTAGHEYIFFVCNRFDELRRQADRDRITSYAYEQLAPRTAFSREGVYFVSALDAVIGREEKKPDLLARSNVPMMEAALAKFLVNERGRIKLLQPARLLAQGIKTALFEVIPNQRKMLAENIADLETRYAEVQPKLAEADQRRQSIVSRLERSRLRLRDAVRDSATLHLRDVAANIPMWASQLQVENRISALKFYNMEGQIKALAEEVVKGVTPMIEESTTSWREKQLQPMISDMMEEFGESANDSVRDFLIDLDHIRADIAQLSAKSTMPEAEISPLERVLSGVGGLLLFTPGSAVEGVTMGYRGVARGLVPQLLIAITGLAILHLNPVAIVAAMVAMGLFRAFRQGDVLTGKAKGEIGKHLAQSLTASIPEQANCIAGTVYEQTEPVLRQIDAGLASEIQSVRDQVETVLKTKQAGVEQVNRQLETLAAAETRLQKAEGDTAEFILRLLH